MLTLTNDTIQPTFTIPFTQVHNKVIDCTKFQKPIDKLVYISLMRFAFQKGHAFPSLNKLAKMNISSENTIRSSLKRLKQLKLVTIEERKEGKQQFSNMYYIHDLPDEMLSEQENKTPPQNLKGGTSKNEGTPPQNLKGGTSNFEPEEEELNKKNMNKKKIKNQSIQEKEIKELQVPSFIQQILLKNIDRLIDDNINLEDITLLFNSYHDKISEYSFAHVLSNVLERTKGEIYKFRNIMEKSIHTYLEAPQTNDLRNSKEEAVIPDWFKDQKKRKNDNHRVSQKSDDEIKEIESMLRAHTRGK